MGEEIIAILGGRGMLGTDLVAACAEPGYIVRTYDLPEFDIRSPAHIRAAVETADAIVNCAAYTDVNGAELQRELAH